MSLICTVGVLPSLSLLLSMLWKRDEAVTSTIL